MIVNEDYIKTAITEAIANSVWKKEGHPDKVRKFDETVELIINIREVDIKNPNNRIDQEILLPHPIPGNLKKVIFIVKDDMEIFLKEKGYPVLNPDDLDKLQRKPNKDKKSLSKSYDYFVVRADLMPLVARVLARFLGKVGKMPRPQPKGFGVITPNENLEEYINKIPRIIKLSMKKQLVIQTKIGKKSQSVDELFDNLFAVLHTVEQKYPNGLGHVQSMYIKTTMGKPTRVKEPERKR